MRWTIGRAAVLAVVVLGPLGCGEDDGDGGNNGGITSLTGTFAGGSETGTLTLEVPLGSLAAPPAPAIHPLAASRVAPVTVTGTIHPSGGSDIALTGSYDPDTHTLGLSGGGYTFAGTFANGSIDGTYSGPNGSGGFSLQPGSGASMLVICGTYSGTDDGTPENGAFNMVLNTGTNAGRVLVVDSGGDSGVLAVSRSGSTLNVYVPGQPSNQIATGTLSGTAADGQYDDGQGASGSWAGSSSACQ